ncbi:MAG: hypothetical protein WCC67_16085, partial [Candidatus Acidiferrales bacterium]
MSPEHDPSNPTSTAESIQTDPPGESSAAISEPHNGSSVVANASSSSGGAAAAVARAQEPVTME